MMMHDVIKKPIVTEKSNQLKEGQQAYVFEVALAAGKPDIKKAVEGLFSVKVGAVKTLIMPGKYKRTGQRTVKTKRWKKAVVTLTQGKIELFEGV
jgi:large subunit ribosomal protein L23